MVQRGLLVVTRDATVLLRKEEYVLDMVLGVLVAMKDATTTLRKEEFVFGTGQK